MIVAFSLVLATKILYKKFIHLTSPSVELVSECIRLATSTAVPIGVAPPGQYTALIFGLAISGLY